jgi:hypothetical protein
MKYLFLPLFVLISLVSCKNETKPIIQAETKIESDTIPNIKFKNKAHELVYNMVQHVGTYSDLFKKNDVVYTYTYQTPDGKKDVSTEKYIFKNELSYGAYQKHERTLPELDGLIEQGYDGETYWLKHKNNLINDSKMLERVAFNRPTNYYWFTMMQKLLDPGLKYDHVGTTSINNSPYEIVKVTFKSQGDKPTDIYQLYINKNTNLVDQFLFTVVDYGKTDPLLMVLDYETIDGLMIPTKRKYKASNWNADVNDEPWILVDWTNISFDNDLSIETFKP